MSIEDKYLDINRSLWNEKTKHHITSDFYNMNGFLKGQTSLKGPELALLGDVSDKSIIHLQCHFGQDSLSLARMGASVTGTDIAEDAIAYANKLNEQLGLNANFICADTYSVSTVITQQFDIVFASYGVIGWLPDMQQWANVVSQLLKPNGKLVFVEFHPVIWMYDYNFTEIAYSYFNKEAIVETLTGTYADKSADMQMKEIGWNHSLSDVIQSLTNAGVNIQEFKEYDYSVYDCFNNTVQVGDGKWQIKGKEGKMPMMYSLLGVK